MSRAITAIPSPGSVLPCGVMDGVQEAESPPQVVPGHDWHIPRSQEMLCTAPAVIKCCCSPAASQGITHSPLTLQPLTYLPVCHIHSHAPSWKHPTHPQTHFPDTHTHSPTFATHPHYIFTHSNRTSPNQLHTHTLNLPIFQHVYSLNISIHKYTLKHPHPQRYTLTNTHTSIHPGPEHSLFPTPFTLPPKQTISYKTVRTVPLLRTVISSAPSRVSSMYYTINICGMINKNPHIIYLYPQDPPNLQKPPNTQNSHMLTSHSHSPTHTLHNTHSHSPTCTCLQHISTFKIHQCLTHINIKHTPTHISTCQLQIQHNTHTTYSSYMISVLTKPNSKHTKFRHTYTHIQPNTVSQWSQHPASQKQHNLSSSPALGSGLWAPWKHIHLSPSLRSLPLKSRLEALRQAVPGRSTGTMNPRPLNFSAAPELLGQPSRTGAAGHSDHPLPSRPPPGQPTASLRGQPLPGLCRRLS